MTWLPSCPDFTTHGHATAPKGWTDLITRRPELHSLVVKPAIVTMTAAKAVRLTQINIAVNKRIKYVRDNGDTWRIPDTEGDCEDYAIAKVIRCEKFGFERGALRLAILYFRTRVGTWECHCVLAVSTDHGPFILDNRFLYWRLASRCVGYYWSIRSVPGSARWERIRLPKGLRT